MKKELLNYCIALSIHEGKNDLISLVQIGNEFS